MSLRQKSSLQHTESMTTTGDLGGSPDDGGSKANWFHATPKLLFWTEIPEWQKDNEYILSGYRPTSGSYWISLTSLSYLNNQTINTYSHLLGCLVFLLLPIHFYLSHYAIKAYAQPVDIAVVTIYCVGVAICFAFSATFHILWNHSKPVSRFYNTLDYLGILVLMTGASIPSIYYGFFCNETLRIVYWTTTTFTALGCVAVTLNPYFAQPRFRHWRALFYAGFGLSSLIFVIHGLIKYGWEVQKVHMSLVWMCWMALANLSGALVYAVRVPERIIPYRFDIFGASHQIFHTAVIVAAVLHYIGLLRAFDTIRSRPATANCVGI